MKREDIQDHIQELCQRIMTEEKPAILLALMEELNVLITLYRKQPGQPEERGPPLNRFYTPNEIDIEWAKTVLRIIKNDGIVQFPSSGLVYQINHDKKTLTLRNPEILMETGAFITHLKTVEVFKDVEYTVIFDS